MPDEPAPSTRHWRFSLRGVLGAVACISLALALFRAAVSLIPGGASVFCFLAAVWLLGATPGAIIGHAIGGWRRAAEAAMIGGVIGWGAYCLCAVLAPFALAVF
jgi:hypothetical protein